jgi:hypothetical protein
MDIVSDTKAELRLRQWTKIIQDCQNSDLTVTAWCNQNNVGVKAYYYWLRKIRLKACQSMACQSPATKQEIVPLQLNPHQSSGSVQPTIAIHLGAASIDIAEGTSQATIEAVLRSLQSIC